MFRGRLLSFGSRLLPLVLSVDIIENNFAPSPLHPVFRLFVQIGKILTELSLL